MMERLPFYGDLFDVLPNKHPEEWPVL